MYRYASQARMNVTNVKLRQRVVLVLLIILMAAVIALGIYAASASAFRSNTEAQLRQRMLNSASAAVDQANRMESTTNSSTSQKLGIVRQYIYNIEQLHNMSIVLLGEKGRVIPDEAFTALYSDLSNYEAIVQSAKTSTLDVRSLLITHLTGLQAYIAGDIIS